MRDIHIMDVLKADNTLNQIAMKPLEIKALTYDDELWVNVSNYAKHCSWKAGASLSKLMSNNILAKWERVFVALIENEIAGFCTLLNADCIPNVEYTPFIGFIFVGESYRGNRISEKLCLTAIKYAKSIGFDRVYLVSDHINLYDKYGFIKIDEKEAPCGAMQTIFYIGTS